MSLSCPAKTPPTLICRHMLLIRLIYLFLIFFSSYLTSIFPFFFPLSSFYRFTFSPFFSSSFNIFPSIGQYFSVNTTYTPGNEAKALFTSYGWTGDKAAAYDIMNDDKERTAMTPRPKRGRVTPMAKKWNGSMTKACTVGRPEYWELLCLCTHEDPVSGCVWSTFSSKVHCDH
jgi:hypothetical protein